MTKQFSTAKRERIKQAAGYFCEICGDWRPPAAGDVVSRLEAHSINRTHKDHGVSVCRRPDSHCHDKLHQLGDDPVVIEKITRTAIELNNLSVAINLTAQGVPEKRVVRVLGRLGNV